MKTVSFVPIKLNNERLPNKNIKPFDNGEPLVQYILKTLKLVESIDEIYVFCSDEQITKYLPEGVQFLKRSDCLDSSNTKINEVIAAFINEVDADIYLLSHATSPFIQVESIEKGLREVRTGSYDSAFSVQKLQEFLWREGEPFNYKMSEIPRTQDIEPLYMETSGFYIFKKEVFINKHRRIGTSPLLVEVSKIEGMDIDEQEDFEIANALYNSLLKEKMNG